jgi:hypothetical protein
MLWVLGGVFYYYRRNQLASMVIIAYGHEIVNILGKVNKENVFGQKTILVSSGSNMRQVFL